MRARFFCDSCGASVGARADRCPACGKAFAAVRCPQCAYEGTPSEFARGCKVCGYLAPGDAGAGRPKNPRPRKELPLSRGAAAVLAVGLLAILAVLLFLVVRR